MCGNARPCAAPRPTGPGAAQRVPLPRMQLLKIQPGGRRSIGHAAPTWPPRAGGGWIVRPVSTRGRGDAPARGAGLPHDGGVRYVGVATRPVARQGLCAILPGPFAGLQGDLSELLAVCCQYEGVAGDPLHAVAQQGARLGLRAQVQPRGRLSAGNMAPAARAVPWLMLEA
eukprot:scaffold697_cov320-Prasinococcus_capsulatus_cf.AAC.3